MEVDLKSLLLIILLLFIVYSCKDERIVNNPSTTFDTLSYGLVAYYPFSGDINNELENGLNVENHGATFTTNRNGLPNSSLNFNGVDNYIQIQDTSTLAFGSGDFTISFWLKRDTTGIRTDVISKKETYTNPSMNDFSVTVSPADTMYVLLRQSVNNNEAIVSYSKPINRDWFYTTIVRDHSNLILYVNGIIVKRVYSSADITSDGPMRIGANRVDPSGENGAVIFPFKGNIDELRIYNRPLNDTEIKELYELDN